MTACICGYRIRVVERTTHKEDIWILTSSLCLLHCGCVGCCPAPSPPDAKECGMFVSWFQRRFAPRTLPRPTGQSSPRRKVRRTGARLNSRQISEVAWAAASGRFLECSGWLSPRLGLCSSAAEFSHARCVSNAVVVAPRKLPCAISGAWRRMILSAFSRRIAKAYLGLCITVSHCWRCVSADWQWRRDACVPGRYAYSFLWQWRLDRAGELGTACFRGHGEP